MIREIREIRVPFAMLRRPVDCRRFSSQGEFRGSWTSCGPKFETRRTQGATERFTEHRRIDPGSLGSSSGWFSRVARASRPRRVPSRTNVGGHHPRRERVRCPKQCDELTDDPVVTPWISVLSVFQTLAMPVSMTESECQTGFQSDGTVGFRMSTSASGRPEPRQDRDSSNDEQ